MRIRSLLLFEAFALVCASSLPGQNNHRPDWKSGASPNVFDRMEKQANGSPQLSPGERDALRKQREAKLADLNHQLAGIIRTATDLQELLKSVDADATLSVVVRNHGKQLEESARKIRKQIGDL